MAATIPPGYQNKGNGIWFKDIKIKGKTFTIEVDPNTEQKWIYEKDFFGSGKPLLTIDSNSPNGVTRERDQDGKLIPTDEDNFSYSERINDLVYAGIDGKLLIDSLKQETTWVNVKGTQPAPQAAGAQGGTQSDGSSTDPGSQAATVGAGISTYNLDDFVPLENVLSNFVDTSFNKIKNYLYYPENIGKSGQDKIIITQIEYVPGNLGDALTGSLSNRESDFNKSTKEKPLGTVTLPIPNELSEANATGWGEDSLSSITAGLMGAALPLVSDIASGKAQAALGDLDRIKKELESSAVSTRLTQFLTVNAAASVLKFAGIQVNPEAYITRATGAAVNPNLELLFQGPKLRQFGFTFKMTPRSEAEARNIRSILKFFKKGMAPRRSKEEATSIFLGTPNVFRIAFTSGGGELTSIGKIKTCALVSFNVNYTPDGFYAAFQDPSAGGSQPVSVVMQMGFTELTPIFNDEYDGDVAGVGPENIFEKFEVKPAQDSTSGGT